MGNVSTRRFAPRDADKSWEETLESALLRRWTSFVTAVRLVIRRHYYTSREPGQWSSGNISGSHLLTTVAEYMGIHAQYDRMTVTPPCMPSTACDTPTQGEQHLDGADTREHGNTSAEEMQTHTYSGLASPQPRYPSSQSPR